MAFYHAAFDESGNEQREKIVFAGIVATATKWAAFNQAWNDNCKQAGITFWKTVDAVHKAKQFKQFRGRDQDFEKIALRFCDIICENALSATFHAIDRKSFDQLSSNQRRTLKRPLYAAFKAGLINLVSGFHARHSDTITLIYHDSEEYSLECLKMYRQFKAQNSPFADNIVGLCFLDDRFTPSLQAADLIAGCWRMKEEGTVRDVWKVIMDKILDHFSDHTGSDIDASGSAELSSNQT